MFTAINSRIISKHWWKLHPPNPASEFHFSQKDVISFKIIMTRVYDRIFIKTTKKDIFVGIHSGDALELGKALGKYGKNIPMSLFEEFLFPFGNPFS